jgi:hypothetical protein
MSFDPWGTPGEGPVTGWTAQPVLPVAGPDRRRKDLATFGVIVVALLLLAAPVGLLWSAVAPHYQPVLSSGQLTIPNIESDKAAIGADGSYVVVLAVAGLLCGAACWWGARRSGPWTILALVVGGSLAAVIAAKVGVMPGQQASLDAIAKNKPGVELYLGARDLDKAGHPYGRPHLRAPWGAVAWPVGALLAFAVPAFVRPEELD